MDTEPLLSHASPAVSAVPKYVFLKARDFSDTLTKNQIRAINVLRSDARALSESATPNLRERIRVLFTSIRDHPDASTLDKAKCVHTEVSVDELLQQIKDYVANDLPITVNLPPHVLKIIQVEDRIKNSYETGSKGKTYDNQRDYHENACFLDLYDKVDGPERPKYGAINYTKSTMGAAPRYGTSYVVLNNTVRKRCTIAAGDTFGRHQLGVLDYCDHILTTFSDAELLGLWEGMRCTESLKAPPVAYKEIQIHGELLYSKHVQSAHE